MNWLIDEAETILRVHGYSTVRVNGPDAAVFEDDTLLGFVVSYPTTRDLLAQWSADQMALLTRFSSALRVAREKAWSVYLVMLAKTHVVDGDERFQLEMLEADLTSTRKLPRTGIETSGDLIAALNSVLPITNKADLTQEGLTDRLRQRLEADVGSEIAELFLSKASESLVAQAMIESET